MRIDMTDITVFLLEWWRARRDMISTETVVSKIKAKITFALF